jgi:hypothetical protein
MIGPSTKSTEHGSRKRLSFYSNANQCSDSLSSLHLRLLPLKRTMTEVDNDVRETYEALTELIENDDLLADLCRTAEAASDQTQVAGNEVSLSQIVARWRPYHIKAFRLQSVRRYHRLGGSG